MPQGVLELYGECAFRERLTLLPRVPHIHDPQDVLEDLEFVLLLRLPTARARMLRRWHIPREEHRLELSGTGSVRVDLRFDGRDGSAVVVIDGLRQPFKERIRLPEQERE